MFRREYACEYKELLGLDVQLQQNVLSQEIPNWSFLQK